MNFKAFLPLSLLASLALYGAELNPFAFPRTERSIAMEYYGLRGAEALSPTELQVVFGTSLGGDYDKPEAYSILSFDDPAYGYTKSIRPRSVSVIRQELELKTSYAGNFMKTVLKLTLPQPMKEGCRYAVATEGITYGRTGASVVYPQEAGKTEFGEKNMEVLGFRGIENLGESCLRLMFGPAFNPAEAAKTQNYLIKINGRAVPFEMISTRSVIDGHRAQGNPLETILRHDVFVKLTDASVKAGDRIHVEVAWNVTSSAQDALLTFRPERTFTSVLHIDEYGYLADQDSKEMYLFCWMGDYPAVFGGIQSKLPLPPSKLSIAYPENLPFKVFSERDGKLIFSGKIRPVPQSRAAGVWNRDFPSEKIYSIDLTPLTLPGTYFISIGGIGRSLPFQVRK